MADHKHTLKFMENCGVSPPSGSVPSTSLPLSFFDIPWLLCHPVQRIFFYQFPHPTNHFLRTALPALKHSLSLTLQHFFPFAGSIIFPPKPHFPYILYNDGNSVPFTVAESTADFTQLISDSPQDVRDWHELVPALPSPRISEDGTRCIPVLAVQVTVLPNSGFCICLTYNHVAGDGRAFHHFMKFWASVCRGKGDFTSIEASLVLPLHNREMIEDTKGIKHIYLEQVWDSTSATDSATSHVPDVFTDKVRATFVLNRDQIEKLKKWVSECTSNGFEEFHISTFVVACSLIWVCMVKSEESNVNTAPKNDNALYSLIFYADCTNHSGLSIPSRYFGNCLTSRTVTLKRRELVGENGIVEAVNAVGRQVSDIKTEALREAERMMSNYTELIKKGASILTVAGSPKFGVYETDFGWEKPKKSDAVHIDFSDSMSLSDCRDKEGGIEVGVALGKIQMSL